MLSRSLRSSAHRAVVAGSLLFAPFAVTFSLSTVIACAAVESPLYAQTQARIHGEVHDPLGALVPHASIELLTGTNIVATTTSAMDGSFDFAISKAGRYTVRATAPTFETTTTPSMYLGESGKADLTITMATRTVTQQVTVTATGMPTPEAQVGSALTVLSSDEYQSMLEVQEPLRLIPGVQLTQIGQMGGTTGLSIRGGDTDANKVLIDGVPINAVGGGVEFANVATTGLRSIEVLREPNSALYGSDALAGVVNLTSAKGTTRLPLFTYAGEAGNFGTYRNEVTAGTTYRQFDLYSAFARIDSRNNIPGSAFHNATYSGNFGWTPNAANDLRFTVRHLAVSGGQPNAIALYGIADDAQQKEQDDIFSGLWSNQTTPRWHNAVRYGGLRLNGQYNSFGATGIPDPNTGDYDGAPVTITGANGYTVSGQAVFQYSSDPSSYLSPTTRNFVYAQTDYRLNPHMVALSAFKFEKEHGSFGYAGKTLTTIDRGNYSYTMQVSGDLRNRLFYNLGAGLEDNGLFGFAASPRASLAYYLSRPDASGFFSGTKLHGSFGKGIKEPSVYQQVNSLYGTLAVLTNGASLLSQYHVDPLGPENSRTFDAGIDQQILDGRARIGVTYFHNQFTNGVQYVPQAGLLQLGVPAASLPAFTYGGAYLNAMAFRSQGVEIETEYKLSSHLFARGGYTFTDAVVQHSFSSDNIGASHNYASNFSTIAIGAYSPLDGARPFRVAPHTGYFGLSYTRSKFFGSLTGTLVSKRDDSDFLSDTNFDTSLLLPNRNLLGSYQRLEVAGGYQLTPRINVYTNIENLLSEHYFEAFGYPALPLTFRSGLKLNFGGESWSLR